METISTFILRILSEVNNDSLSYIDKETIATLRAQVDNEMKLKTTIERCGLAYLSFISVALNRVNCFSKLYPVYFNMIQWLKEIIRTRLNIGLISMYDINEFVAVPKTLAYLDNDGIGSIIATVNEFKYLKYEGNKVIFNLHEWMREAVDWTITQKMFYVFKKDVAYQVLKKDDGTYYYIDEESNEQPITFEEIITTAHQYLMDLYFTIDSSKFYQITRRRVITTKDTISSYYDQIYEETDMSKYNNYELRNIYTTAQNKVVQSFTTWTNFISGVYTDETFFVKVDDTNHIETEYTDVDKTTKYKETVGDVEKIYEMADPFVIPDAETMKIVPPDKPVVVPISNPDLDIEGDIKVGNWKRKYTEITTKSISNTTTQELTSISYGEYSSCNKKDDGTIELTDLIQRYDENKTITTTMYPTLIQTIKTEKYIKTNDEDPIQYTQTLTEITYNNNEKRYENSTKTTTKSGVEHEFENIPEIPNYAYDTTPKDIRFGEKVVFEFDRDLEQIPSIRCFGYLYNPRIDVDKFYNTKENDDETEFGLSLYEKRTSVKPTTTNVVCWSIYPEIDSILKSYRD